MLKKAVRALDNKKLKAPKALSVNTRVTILFFAIIFLLIICSGFAMADYCCVIDDYGCYGTGGLPPGGDFPNADNPASCADYDGAFKEFACTDSTLLECANVCCCVGLNLGESSIRQQTTCPDHCPQGTGNCYYTLAECIVSGTCGDTQCVAKCSDTSLPPCVNSACQGATGSACQCGSDTAAVGEYCCAAHNFAGTKPLCDAQCLGGTGVTVSGVVKLSTVTHDAVPGVSLVLYPASGMPLYTDESDSNGAFEFTDVDKSKTYYLETADSDYVVDDTIVSPDQTAGYLVIPVATFNVPNINLYVKSIGGGPGGKCEFFGGDSDGDGFCECGLNDPDGGPEGEPCDCNPGDLVNLNKPRESHADGTCTNQRDDDCDGTCDTDGCVVDGVLLPADPDCICADNDLDGHTDKNCGGTDCRDFDDTIWLQADCDAHCGRAGRNPSYGEECDTDNGVAGTLDPDSLCAWTATAPPNPRGICNPNTCRCVGGSVEPPDCSAATLTLTATAVEESENINLAWSWSSLSPECTVVSYKLERCKGLDDAECTTGFQEIPLTNPTATSFTDAFNKDEHTKYCYRITPIFSDPNAQPTESNTACVTTGDEICMHPHEDAFCLDYDFTIDPPTENVDVAARCGTQNNVINSLISIDVCDAEGEVCISRLSGGVVNAECVDASVCDLCNGLYSMFWYKNPTITYELGGDTISSSCRQSLMCFEDYTDTTSDIFNSCANVQSCYDYNSQQQCLADPCSASDTSCQWNAINTAIGYGVCVSTDPDKQHCEYCNDRICTEQICAKYGTTDLPCYYDDVANPGIGEAYYCMNKRDVTCLHYDTQEDCVSYDGPTTNTRFDLDVTYGPAPDTLKRVSGTNAETLSDDFFDLGKCQWDTTIPNNIKCQKNANDNAFGDQSTSDTVDFGACSISQNTIDPKTGRLADDCHYDFEEPTTTLVHSSILTQGNPTYGKNLEIPVLVDDNEYSESDIRTYMCITGQGISAGCNSHNYPTSYEWDTDSDNLFEQPITTQGEYTVIYYSIDKAKNIELLKSDPIYVDSTAPTITISSTLLGTYHITGQGWVSDVEIRINSNETASCEYGKLQATGENAGTSPDATVDFENRNFLAGTTYKFTYTMLEDGIYDYELMCSDLFGNEFADPQHKEVRVDSDPTITNPLPTGTTHLLNPVLSIDTASAASCRYDDNEQSHDASSHNAMDFAFTPNAAGTHHARQHTFTTTGLYRFYTSCKITSSGQIYPGSPADMIVFALDRAAPFTTYYAGNEEGITDTKWFNTAPIIVTFTCNDESLLLEEAGTGAHKDLGCKKLFFCDTNNCNPSALPDSQVTIQDRELSYQKSYSSSANITFYASDGHNNETKRTIKLNIDTTAPALTITVLKGGVEASSLTYGTYEVKVQSSKPLNPFKKFLNYTFDGVEVVMPTTALSQDGKTYTAPLIISSENWYEKTGTVSFKAQATDTHGILSSQQKDVPINTVAPTTPKFDPLFETAGSQNTNTIQFSDRSHIYPLFYYAESEQGQDVYFTNQTSLFITGETVEFPLTALFYTRALGAESDVRVAQFVQSLNPEIQARNTRRVSAAGTDKLYFSSIELTSEWASGKYVKPAGHERKSYGHYKEYYKIIAKNDIGAGTTAITLASPLEGDVALNEEVKLFSRPYPETWFGNYTALASNIAALDMYLFYVSASDQASGIGSSTLEYSLFVDTTRPLISLAEPRGTIGDPYTPLKIQVKEPLFDSGIDNDSILLTITHAGVTREFTKSTLNITKRIGGGYKYYNISLRPAEPWNGSYMIDLSLHDYAFNDLDDSGLNFGNCFNVVDQCCVADDDDVCDHDCGVYVDTSGIYHPLDPDCPPCTNAANDCCFPILDGVVDPDCPDLDPDSLGCEEGACDAENQMYCHNDMWVSAGYCDDLHCGLTDSTCCDTPTQGCCTPGSCDLQNNKYCEQIEGQTGPSSGRWTSAGYNIYCGPYDAGCLDINGYLRCTDDACDIHDAESRAYCRDGLWSGISTSVDENCVATSSIPGYQIHPTVPCQNEACDTDAEYFCTTGGTSSVWSNTDYAAADNCGTLDQSYGCPVCSYEQDPVNCDITSNLLCNQNNYWSDANYCDYANCGMFDLDCIAFCKDIKDDCCYPFTAVCDPDCQEFQDPQCSGCTIEADDCCVALIDEVCDPDCPPGVDPDSDRCWYFNVDNRTPSRPKFRIMESPLFNPDSFGRWFVADTTPNFLLDFRMRNDSTIETLNITTPIFEVIGHPETVVSCGKVMMNLFSCYSSQSFSEQLYDVSVEASKILPDGSLGPAGEYFFTFGVDLTTPVFTLTIPKYANGQTYTNVTASITNDEYELMANITLETGENGLVESINQSNVYYFMIPPEFWQSEGNLSVRVDIMDFAGNKGTRNGWIVVDSLPPNLYITNILITPQMQYSLTNFSSSNNTVLVEGHSDLDLSKIIVRKSRNISGAFNESLVGIANICFNPSINNLFCIDNTHDTATTFRINFTIDGMLDSEILNKIILTAKDQAGNQNIKTLSALYDLLAPDTPTIMLSGKMN